MELTARTLGEVCDAIGGIIRTGPFGSQLHDSDYVDEGIPVVMPKNIIDGRVSTDDIAYIADTDVQRLAHHQLHTGDIVYGRRGDIGRRAFITAKENGWLCGTGCLRISVGDRILDPLFLYYYLGHPGVISWIASRAIGATMPNLNTSILRSVEVVYPSLRIQRQIASILSAYDNLIENNTRRIAIIEETARMLYEELFVKYRFPGHEQVKMVESEMGMIPDGWSAVKLNEAIEIDPTTKVPKDGEKPFVPMSSLSENSMIIENIEARSGNGGSKFKNGDTLIARITPCIENGKTGFVQFLPSADSVAFGSTEFIVLRSKTLCPEYVYLMARSDGLRDLAIKSMSGATGRQRVRLDHLRNFFIAQPDELVLSRFTELMSPIFSHIQTLARKNANLRRTRDKLLPKLISGEIDVSSWVEDGEEMEAVTVAAQRPDAARETGPVEAIDVATVKRPSLWD